IGYQAGANLTGNGNGVEDGIHTAVGSFALFACTGKGVGNSVNDNVAIGQKSLCNVVTGGQNVGVGSHSGAGVLGNSNMMIGLSTGDGGNWTGDNNTVVGTQAMGVSLTPAGAMNNNSIFGHWAATAALNGGVTNLQNNCVFGEEAGFALVAASDNCLFGF